MENDLRRAATAATLAVVRCRRWEMASDLRQMLRACGLRHLSAFVGRERAGNGRYARNDPFHQQKLRPGDYPCIKRNAEMVRLHVEEGYRQVDLAERFGISRQRIAQILRRAGVTDMESRLATGFGLWTCQGCGKVCPSTEALRGRFYCSAACRRKHHRNKGRRKYSPDELLRHLRSLGRRLGRTPTQKDVVEASGPGHGCYYDAFGSFPEALVAAGFMPNRKPNKP